MEPRRSLCTPIPAIFDAARLLLSAVDQHRAGDHGEAAELLTKANDQAVWHYTDQAWGKGAAARYGFVKLANASPHLPLIERPIPRMPTTSTRAAVIARDGYQPLLRHPCHKSRTTTVVFTTLC